MPDLIGDKAARNARLLGDYAQQVARAAAVLTDAIEAAKDEPEKLPALAAGLAKLGRALRQTLALDERFDRGLAARDPAAADASTPAKVCRRVREVQAAVRRVIWREGLDADERIERLEELDERLAVDAGFAKFADRPLDDHVLDMALSLGLDLEAALAWRELPDPPAGDGAEPGPAGDEIAGDWTPPPPIDST